MLTLRRISGVVVPQTLERARFFREIQQGLPGFPQKLKLNEDPLSKGETISHDARVLQGGLTDNKRICGMRQQEAK